MNRNHKVALCRALVSACFMLMAGALSSAATAADFMLRGEKGDLEYHMKEINEAGALLNREDGTLPVWGVGAITTADGMFAEADFWRSEGVLPYVGSSQTGFPVFTLTQLGIQGWKISAGRSWEWGDAGFYKFSLGFRNTQVDRHILPGPTSLALREVLDVFQGVLGLGVGGRLFDISRRPLTGLIEVNLEPQLRNTLAVDSFGLYDPVTLRPGLNVDWSAHVKLSYQVTQRFSLWVSTRFASLAPRGTSFQAWNKNGVPATQVRYPGSQQSLQRVVVGGEISF